MLGLMQRHSLSISSLIDFAERQHGDAEIVSRRVEGDLHRTTWAAVARRARQIANGLEAFQLAFSDRVGTIAWNGYRHLELYYGVSASGRVLHTVNPRLHPEQIAWIINHAEDRVVCFETTFLPLVKAIYKECPKVKHWIVLCEADRMPTDDDLPGLISYEEWINSHSDQYRWPEIDEYAASSMCYTSGTTGHPKAVVYSHRSTVLHAYASALPNAFGLSERDSVLPAVPMFHVNSWGLPYSTAIAGCKVVFPGPGLDGKSLYELMESEGVTLAAGVPTVWQGLLEHVKQNGLRFSTLNRTVVGGAACPPAMIQVFQEGFGVEVLHAWGMTELSPIGTVCSLKNNQLNLPPEEQVKLRAKQGRALYGIELEIFDELGKLLPHDGKAYGSLMARGHWVVGEYFRPDDLSSSLVNGWFPTGDVATIDGDGFVQITDRNKDMIKSGGEWISSIEIENIAMAHPSVQMAACIGIKHPKWDERPIICVVKRPGAEVTREELLAFYEGKVSKWQIPDDVVFLDSIPMGATGKMLKTKLREHLINHRLPQT
ncbi:MAG: 3-(methylthio)propionyl-CoA ligase [Oligoflexia bacterium]|nr:3-(methylthio)propionyl-CoA ligase [Oligoflexia bacterium]